MNTCIHTALAPTSMDEIMKESYAAIDRQVRKTAPKWLRKAGMADLAFRLESLRKVVDQETWAESWADLADVRDAVGPSGSPPDKEDLWADGWTADNCNGRWAVQEDHWRQQGAIADTYGVDDRFDGPLVNDGSSDAWGDAFAIIRAAAYRAQVAA